MAMDIMNISNEQIGEMVKNNPSMMMYLELTGKLKLIEDEFKKFRVEHEIIKAKQEVQDNEISKLIESGIELKDKTTEIYNKVNTLEYNGLAGDLQQCIHSRAFKFTGSKESVANILFYGSYCSQMYRFLKKDYKVNSYKNINADFFDESISKVMKWKPNKDTDRKLAKEYFRKLQRGILKEPKASAIIEYIDQNGGLI